MRQRILGSHTPPCHRRMVITTQFNVSISVLLHTYPEGGGGMSGHKSVKMISATLKCIFSFTPNPHAYPGSDPHPNPP